MHSGPDAEADGQKRIVGQISSIWAIADSVSHACTSAIAYLSILIFGLLGLASVFVTAALPCYTEKVIYAGVTFPIVVAGILVVAFGYTLLYKRLDSVAWNPTIIGLIVAIVLFSGSITWAILCNTFPQWDSYDLIGAAKELGTDDAVYWGHGLYMERYPYQTPYVILIRFLWRLFGDDQLYLSLELVNSFCAGATGFLLVKLSSRLFTSRAAMGTAFATVLFLPLYIYSTFAYGNVPALPFMVGSLVSVDSAVKTRRIRHVIVAAVSVTISVMLKSTMQVALIAICILFILEAIKTHRAVLVAAAPAVLAIYLAVTSAFYAVVSNHYDVVLDNGLPKIAWVVMGLSDPGAEYPEVSNNPGLYSEYVWNWKFDDYDVDVAEEDSKREIASRLKILLSDSGYALEFFGKKIAWMWLEPTFASLVNGNWSESATPDQPVMSERPMTSLLSSIYYGTINTVIVAICDIWQTLILLSTAIVLLRIRKKSSISQLAPALVGLGFFFVYLAWESKSQYTLQVFVVFLAYVGPALNIIAEKLASSDCRLGLRRLRNVLARNS